MKYEFRRDWVWRIGLDYTSGEGIRSFSISFGWYYISFIWGDE